MSTEYRNKNYVSLLNTLDLINNDITINNSLSNSKAKVYTESSFDKKSMGYKTKVSLNNSTVVENILNNRNKKLCTLILSSGIINNNSGLDDSQEASAYRASTLYKLVDNSYCLREYYSLNKKSKNIKTDNCLYVSNVLFFKDNNDIILGEKNKTYSDIIISCPPDLSKDSISSNDLYRIVYNRLKRVFNAAIDNNGETLILGAYGCGRAENSPEVVSKVFKRLLNEYDGYFKEVIFAIKSKNEFDINFSTFKKNIIEQ